MKLRARAKNDYPTSDGRPMAETELHRQLMTDLIAMLTAWFADVPDVHVTGNLLLFYEENNRRQHVSPDVMVTFGIDKELRDNYLLWEEGPPAIVIELTSSSTHREDTDRKMALYRDRIGVAEYFLFDPYQDYLDPPLQGYRLVNGAYRPIRPQRGRLRSRQLDLWLERDGQRLNLIDPATNQRLRLPQEIERERAEAIAEERDAAVEERDAAVEERDALAAALRAAQEELAALRRQQGQAT